MAYRTSENDEIGKVISSHGPKITSVAFMVMLTLFCLAVAVALVSVAMDQHESVEVMKRLGGAALFGVGGVILCWDTWRTARTRVEIGDRGLRHISSVIRVARWEEIESWKILRVNSSVRIQLQVRGAILDLTDRLTDFQGIVEALKRGRILPAESKLL